MTGLSASLNIFSGLINQLEAGRLLAGAQFHTLTHFFTILSAFPEGRPVAERIQSELQASPGRIESVPLSIIADLRSSLSVLEVTMASPSAEAAEAFEKLKRIATLTSSSQAMSAVLNPSTLDRARELGRHRVESPALRYLERTVRSESGGEGATGSASPVFLMDGAVVRFHGRQGFFGILSDHFGSEVTSAALNAVFDIPQKGYRVAVVDVRKDDRGHLKIGGEIRQEKDRVGYFGMSVPPVPPRGNPWAVKVEAISIVHKRVGIASQLLARLALFLHDRGVHTMNADAMEDAGLFCVFNGFRLGKSLYEEIIHEFIEEIKCRGVELSKEHVHRLLDRDANLAELAAFELNGRRTGREFLQRRFTKKYLPVKFELSADKQSWLRLISNLHRSDVSRTLAPLEWSVLSPDTRQMLYSGVLFVGGNVPHFMASDRDHAVHLVERLNNWATMISMMMDCPESMLDRMPQERKTEFQEKCAAIGEVFAMITFDASSSLYSHFSDLISPGNFGATGDHSTNRAFSIADAVLKAAKRGLINIPAQLGEKFEELVSRVY